MRLSAGDLRITGQLPGWREEPGSLQRFTPQTLFDIIDGAAPEYNSRGLVEGIRQMLEGPGGATAEVFVHDFGVPDSARAMLAAKCSSATEKAGVPGADNASTCGSPAIGGCVAYAHSGRFYVEVTISGIADPSEALAAAGQLLTWCRVRAKGGR